MNEHDRSRMLALLSSLADAALGRPSSTDFSDAEVDAYSEELRASLHYRRTAARSAALLAPNHGAERVVRDWPWSIPIQYVQLGTACSVHVSMQPITTVRPQFLVMNIANENMFLLEDFLVNNQSMLDGPHDACVYGSVQERDREAVCAHCGAPPTGPLSELSCPHCGVRYPGGTKGYGKAIACETVRPSGRVTFTLSYTGRVPEGYREGDRFGLGITLVGLRLDCP